MNEIIMRYDLDESIRGNLFLEVKTLILDKDVEDDDKIKLKEAYISKTEKLLESVKNTFSPLQERFAYMDLTQEELDEYNRIKDKIYDLKQEINDINESYKFKDFNKELDLTLKKQEKLLKDFKNLKSK